MLNFYHHRLVLSVLEFLKNAIIWYILRKIFNEKMRNKIATASSEKWRRVVLVHWTGGS